MTKLSYNPAEFIARPEVDVIVGRAQGMTANLQRVVQAKPKDPVTLINAARGSGKSWLLQEVHRRLLEDNPHICSCYVDLSQCHDPEHPTVTHVVECALREVLKCVDSPPLLPVLSRYDLSDRLKKIVTDGRRKLHVVLIDHVDEQGKDVLDLFEDYCLAILVTLPNVYVVFAGLGKKHHWRNPALRPPPMDLQPFDSAQTQRQIDKQLPAVSGTASGIHDLSEGNPWANYLIGLDRAGTRTDVVEELLGDEKAYRDYFTALCVLRSFDETSMPYLFAEHYQDASYRDKNYGYCREIRQQLVNTHLVKWSYDLSGWVIDAALKAVIENLLKEHDFTRWRGLQCAAYVMYETLANKYPEAKARYQEEMTYHRQQLAAAGLTPEECQSTH